MADLLRVAPGPPADASAFEGCSAAPASSAYERGMPVLVVVRDLLFRSRISAAAERLGVPIRVAPRGVPLAEAARELGEGTVLADLGEPGALDQIRGAKAVARVRVIGFLGHLQVDLARAAEAAGVDEVLSRGELVQRMDEVLLGAGGSGAPARDR
jgi:hypothetical protein